MAVTPGSSPKPLALPQGPPLASCAPVTPHPLGTVPAPGSPRQRGGPIFACFFSFHIDDGVCPMTALPTFSVSEAAELTGRSVQWIYQLAKAGHIAKEGRGRYPISGLLKGVIAYYEQLLEKASQSAAASKATDARTREIELRIAERRRELIAADEARAVIMEFGAMVRAEFGALPARFTRDMDERRKLEQEVHGSFERIAAAAERAATALAAPERDLPAEHAA